LYRKAFVSLVLGFRISFISIQKTSQSCSIAPFPASPAV
jgi:hypothetical protein